jgi:hypothetical protein
MIFFALAIAATTSIPTAMADQSSSKTEAAWPSDERKELSQEQVSIGLRLAGSAMRHILDDDQCHGGVRDSFNYCILGKYKLHQETPHSVTGYLQSTANPDTYSPVIIINSSDAYLNSNLDPKQARAISVDFAEAVLNRKLNEIDPKDPDTFFDPRDLDLMNLFFRATQKVEAAFTKETCSGEMEALFRDGKQTPCTYGPFFVRKSGEHDYTMLTRKGNQSVISGYFGGGSLLMDATISDAEKINNALEFVEATLNINRESITGIPQRAKNTASDERFASVTKKIIDFSKGRKCDDEASWQYLEGTSTNCEVAGYFFARQDGGDYHVRMRGGPNSTNLAFEIKNDKPFMRFYDLADKPFLDTSKVVPELDTAFAKLEQKTGK